METLVSCPLAVAAGVLVIPITVFFLEIVAAILLPPWERAVKPSHVIRPRVAVLVPAHDESTVLLPTLTDIKGQLLPGDRLLVVADNCSDDTAVVALAAGAEVVERHDPAKLGKGYALDFGLRHLSLDPPEIVVIIDADCRLAADTLDRLATTCAATRRPVQALYLMTAPDGSGINLQVAEFAWRVKNQLRPLGLNAFGLPCQLMGTGMAFPWDVIRRADLAHGWLVEDVRLGLNLAAMGHPPVFCPSARVTSCFASSVTGAGVQRSRWEQGHLETILHVIPRMLRQAVARRNWGLLALALDLAVPPLSLLSLLVIAILAIGATAAFLGLSSLTLAVSSVTLMTFSLAAFLAWLKCGSDVLPPRAIWSIAPYAFGKLGLYCHILFNRMDTQWVRTDRTKSR